MDVGTITNPGLPDETKIGRPSDSDAMDSDLSPNNANKLKQASRAKRSAGDDISLDGAASETSNGDTSPGAPPPLKKKALVASNSSTESTVAQSKGWPKASDDLLGDDAAALLMGFADSVLQERPSTSSNAVSPSFGSSSSNSAKNKKPTSPQSSVSPGPHSLSMFQSSPHGSTVVHHGLGDMTPVSAAHAGSALFGTFAGTSFNALLFAMFMKVILT